MGTVRRLAPAAGDVTGGQATLACLVTLGGAGQASTRRTDGRILRRVVAESGAETAPALGWTPGMTPGMPLEDSWT